MLLAAIFVAVVALLLTARSVVVVPRDQAVVVERLGRFDRVLTSGMHVLPPVLSSIRARVPLGEQRLDVAPVSCTTRDGAAATCRGSVTFRVVDAAAATYAVADYRSAVVQAASSAWSGAVAGSELIAAPAAVENAQSSVQGAVAPWGLQVTEVRPVLTLSDEAGRELAARAGAERDARIAAWARERGRPPAADGRPTAAQRAAYEEWMALEVRANQPEIEGARRAFEEAAASPAFAPAAAALQFAVASSTIAPGELGSVEAGGRDWAARNVSATAIARGFRCAVERQEGDTLFVRAL
jgi:regulator of protease activity HflC (stomatin/prohibitin superfamily)